eukprot:761662-Hanusia_phi.AAC.1
MRRVQVSEGGAGRSRSTADLPSAVCVFFIALRMCLGSRCEEVDQGKNGSGTSDLAERIKGISHVGRELFYVLAQPVEGEEDGDAGQGVGEKRLEQGSRRKMTRSGAGVTKSTMRVSVEEEHRSTRVEGGQIVRITK